jgi:c-di-GMP-binding flagellar brake protein YcgR
MTDHKDKRSSIDIASTDREKYLVHWRTEIVSILGDLCHIGSLVTAYIDGQDDDFILTSIIAVKLEQNTVLLDFGADAAANKRAMRADKIVCVTALDGIQIQMSAEAFRPARFEGRDVFAMTMPETLLRLQRREYYRIGTPRFNPLVCIVAPGELPPGVSGELVIDDISCGGIAVGLSDAMTGIETGTRFNRCRIPLPEMTEATTNFGGLYSGSRRMSLPESVDVITDIVVRGMVEITFPNGVKHRHAGCEFINMRERDRSLVQRYVSKLEHERRYRVASR